MNVEEPQEEAAPGWYQVALLDGSGNTLYREKHYLAKGSGTVALRLEQMPVEAVLDPQRLLLGLNRQNNRLKIAKGNLDVSPQGEGR